MEASSDAPLGSEAWANTSKSPMSALIDAAEEAGDAIALRLLAATLSSCVRRLSRSSAAAALPVAVSRFL
jgi:hypothetical protein